MTIDLHLHTTVSDGLHTPLELLQMAVTAGVTTLSITDHESIEGCLDIADAAEEQGIRVIPGVELLVTYAGEEIHLLGYGMDLTDRPFLMRLAELRQARNVVAEQTVRNLQNLGIPLAWDDVAALAHPHGAISKGHIVHALHLGGLLTHPAPEFIGRYLSREGLAHVEYDANSFDQGVELIRAAGGVPVVAHPGLIHTQSLLPELLRRPHVGLEVFYGYYGPHREQWVREYRRIAEAKKLVMTGGTDYHGPFAPFKPGSVSIPDWVMPQLDRAMAMARQSRQAAGV
ncbi:PHP domain-containing protein [Heliobacterium gestii]|uniref:PHP domain-containing protein n=1 Tax=Heliomicrobium gestii TaxID=2699 RepID=A0A845LFU8_HELGE|nr:PHP domain-containing protein [Heliomicrobium gestii]MBM7867274.1 putative metal-dependent phosphoesterase TrpH [Heliomicrobium gestii]MZP43830.1 PHP domain-containing protein [Heliomicrobium gestii]